MKDLPLPTSTSAGIAEVTAKKGYFITAPGISSSLVAKSMRCKPGGQAQRFLREAYSLRYVERKNLRAGPSGVAYRDLEKSDDEIPGMIVKIKPRPINA